MCHHKVRRSRFTVYWRGILATALVTAGLHALAQTQTPPPKDTGETLRGSLKQETQSATPNFSIDPIEIRPTPVDTKITFRAVVRDQSLQVRAFTFSLVDAPNGASIDAQSGMFTWTPAKAGTFTFIVSAVAQSAPERPATRTVTIRVIDAIENFGYRFFERARAAVDAKLASLRKPEPVAPPATTPPATTGAVATDPQTQAQQLPPATAAQPPAAEPLPSMDPLKQVIGPFDLMGANISPPAPERYQLGPGDLLTIRFWSPTLEVSERDLRIDQFGGINLPASGRRIILRGKTLVEAESLLKKEMQLLVTNADLTLTLKELRTMSIIVTGEAYLPGNYQMPAVATLFNALYIFGGPSENGSLRNIEIRRTDGTRRTFDFYRFLIFGDASQDVPLQPGDVVYIPPVARRVTVKGEVMRPSVYELKPVERLRDALALAGGAKSSGVTQRISLSTVQPGVGRKLDDVDLSSTSPDANPPVFDGDTIEVFSVRPVLTNVVEVSGAVDQPGQYALMPDMTVADLVERARGVIREGHLGRADLFRTNPDQSTSLIPVDLAKALSRDPENNPKLELFDKLVVYRLDDVQWMGDRTVRVRGAVQSPGRFYRADNMRVGDLLLQARGIDGSAYTQTAYIQRTNADGTLGDLIRIDLSKAIANDPGHNILLQDRDELTVQTVQQANYVPDQTVRILGAVQAPGTYPRASNLTLKDLLDLAGGPMPNAGQFVEIARSRVPINTAPVRVPLTEILAGGAAGQYTLGDGDLVTVSENKDFALGPKTVLIMGEVASPGPYALQGDSERISSLVKRAGGVTGKAFAEGAQFLRDPRKLKLPVQEDLSPRIREVLRLVADDEYKRALARSEVERARFIINAQQSSVPSIPIPGLGTADTGKSAVEVPQIKGEAVTKARSLTNSELEPAGNLDVNLPQALSKMGSSSDLILEEGDIIIIPPKPTTVTVSGAVTIPAAVLFEPGKTVGNYIDKAGGPTVDAALDRVLVIRARGSVTKANKNTRVELGDIVFVPTKVMAVRFTDREADIDQVSKRVTAAGVLFAIIRSLLG